MKKAKIMLLTIVALAAIGAAFAFKVKKNGSSKYCYLITTTQPAAGGCINGLCNIDMDHVSDLKKFYYTVTNDCSKCNHKEAANLACPNEAELPLLQ